MSTETTTTEVTEFEDGSRIIETRTVESEYIEADNPPQTVEVAEPIEEVTEAAVQIAEIEAERDVAIAEIQAEVSTAAIEASEEQNEWQQNIEALQTAQLMLAEQVGALTEAVSSIQAALTPAEPLPPMNSPESAAEGAPDQADPQAAEPPKEPPARPKRSRWI